jgi:hypothetical protein
MYNLVGRIGGFYSILSSPVSDMKSAQTCRNAVHKHKYDRYSVPRLYGLVKVTSVKVIIIIIYIK